MCIVFWYSLHLFDILLFCLVQIDFCTHYYSSMFVMQPKASEFARHVLWEFEDLRMLIGSDLPIFGGGKYPAVSLRLR